MKIPQSSTSTRRLRAREKAPNLLLREEEEEEHERREFKRFFLSRERRERTRKKKNKEIKRDFQAVPKEERTTPFLLLLFVFVSLVLLLLLHLSLLARTRLLFATAPAFRGHRSAFIVIIILYIFPFFLCIISLLLLFGGQKFLSFSLSLSPKRQTDRHTLCDHSLDERDPRRERGKGVASASLLFSFFSKAIRKFCVVTLLLREKEMRHDVKASSTSKLDIELGCNTLNKMLRTSPPSALENTSNVHTFEQHLT